MLLDACTELRLEYGHVFAKLFGIPGPSTKSMWKVLEGTRVKSLRDSKLAVGETQRYPNPNPLRLSTGQSERAPGKGSVGKRVHSRWVYLDWRLV